MVQNLGNIIEDEVINFFRNRFTSKEKRFFGRDDGRKLSDCDMLEEMEKYVRGETTEFGERLYKVAEELYHRHKSKE